MPLIDLLILSLAGLLLVIAISIRYPTTNPVRSLIPTVFFVPGLWLGWSLVVNKPLPVSLTIAASLFCGWLLVSLLPTTSQPNLSALLSNRAIVNKDAALINLTKEEELKLKNCFPLGLYYLQAIEYRTNQIICRGQLRQAVNTEANSSKNSERLASQIAYRTVQTKIQEAFGDRFVVLLQEHVNSGDRGNSAPEQTASQPYVFILTPSDTLTTSAIHNSALEWGLTGGLALLTLLSLASVGVKLFVNPDLVFNWSEIQNCLIYIASVSFILLGREVTRGVVAQRLNVKVPLPYFLPFPFMLGSLGTLPRMPNFMPNRRVLWRLAIAPNLFSLIVSLIAFIWGLAYSNPLAASIAHPQVYSSLSLIDEFVPFDPKISLGIAILLKGLTNGQVNNVIAMHPLAAAGWFGLVITSVSLIPIGALEGGQLVRVILGGQRSIIVGQISRLLLLALALISQPWLCTFALGLFLLKHRTQIVLDDATELETFHEVCGLALIAVGLLMMMPVPKFLTPLLSFELSMLHFC